MSNLHKDELEEVLRDPARILAKGGLIAFPTETVYGLGANALSEEAVLRIFTAKGRPADNPLIVHIAHLEDIAKVTDEKFQPSAAMQKAMDAFWPGPLTIIMPVNQRIARSVHPNMDTIGVRMPAHPVARALIDLSGCPIAAPSANRSGLPSPTTALDVQEDMEGRIDGIVDGGPCVVGLESTVVAITDTEAVIYRPGGITKEQLEAVLGVPVSLDPHLTSPASAKFTPKSPGMKYRHYAPNATVDVWWGDLPRVREAMTVFYDSLPESEQAATALIAPREIATNWPGVQDSIWTGETWTGEMTGEETSEGTDETRTGTEDSAMGFEAWAPLLSQALYHQLREFDRRGMKRILICGVNPADGIGSALMNRLQKSSEGRIHAV